jgi:alanyl-tRNA synthetase
MAGFETAMEEQRVRARAASQFESKGQLPAELASTLAPTKFLGYDAVNTDGSRLLAIVRGGRGVESLADGEEAIQIIDRTPF